MSIACKVFLSAIVAAFLTSCASTPRLYQTAAQTGPPRYSLIFMIHGDANYVFHDTVGIAHYADEEALAKAHVVARANPAGEVFIFHDKPLSKTLFFFKRRDGDFYYYRNGQLVATHSYWRDEGEGSARFAVHGALYHQFRAHDSSVATWPTRRMLLYFGHEIPEVDGLHYDASYPDSTLTVSKFTNDLLAFSDRNAPPIASDQSKYFDLIVMSTCFNGTPHSVAALAPHTRYVIASPTNLHLSYLDIAAFEHLENTLANNDVAAFARFAARAAFQKLSASVQTVVSVALYDVSKTVQYTQSVDAAYRRSLTTIATAPTLTLAHCDCTEQAPFNSPFMHEGVEVLYRPAKFGRDANKPNHSGWSCWKNGP